MSLSKKNRSGENENHENVEYLKYVRKHAPITNQLKTLVPAFIIGGIICMIGQLISDIFTKYTNFNEEDVSSLTCIVLIFIGSLLTGIGVYDRIGRVAGGGSIVPITGFANSIVSPAMEYNREGIIFGICAEMFIISGPIIVMGITVSLLVGLIGLIFV